MASNTHHLLDAEVAAVVDRLPITPINRQTLAAIRADAAKQMEALLPTLPSFGDVEVSEHQVPGPSGAPDVTVLRYRPLGVDADLPALLWIHGGGYVAGRAQWDDVQVKTIVRQVGCCVVSVEYRLAPETPFPGPVDDCYAALRWVHANAASLRIDASRIAIAGLSAGGGLAAALGLLARDLAQVPLMFQLLLQPMLDDRQATEAYQHPWAGEYVWRQEYNHFGWSSLLGHEPGIAGVSSYASPARATTLAGLPPTYISVGSIDLFIEENIEYARRLIRDGVPTELHVYPGACHAFQLLAPTSYLAQAHDRDMFAALRRAFQPAFASDPA